MRKDITFIYMDKSDKALYEPIVKEAEQRGYRVKLTDNKFEKCEIGVYCQHYNHPQFSKFSVIMLHDIIQQYSNWPDIWYKEPWNKYDVGILPSVQWEKNWNQCSQFAYARPKRGMYKIGWPKADKVAKLKAETYRDDFFDQYCLDLNKRTILYAPAWENDGKQDDFVQAMLKLDVNILIKQAPWNPELYPQQVHNISEMYELHKNIDRVTILPPETNIFEAIAVSDVLVSEESSTMCEAVMMGIPAVSVSDWLIPDVTPSRYPQCNYSFVNMCKKAELTDHIQMMLDDYEKYHEEAKVYSAENFSNMGKTSVMIMDIIDDYINGNPVRYPRLAAKSYEKLSLSRWIKHRVMQFKFEVVYNYCVRNAIVNYIYRIYKTLKNL